LCSRLGRTTYFASPESSSYSSPCSCMRVSGLYLWWDFASFSSLQSPADRKSIGCEVELRTAAEDTGYRGPTHPDCRWCLQIHLVEVFQQISHLNCRRRDVRIDRLDSALRSHLQDERRWTRPRCLGVSEQLRSSGLQINAVPAAMPACLPAPACLPGPLFL
jgi:hypothetical protein